MQEETDKVIRFMSFDNYGTAVIVKGRLEANGIECFLSNAERLNLGPFHSSVNEGISLNIFEKDIEKVKAILGRDDEISETDPEADWQE